MESEEIIKYFQKNLINYSSKESLDIEERCLKYYLDDFDLDNLESLEVFYDLFEFKLYFNILGIIVDEDKDVNLAFYEIFESVDNYMDMRLKAID